MLTMTFIIIALIILIKSFLELPSSDAMLGFGWQSSIVHIPSVLSSMHIQSLHPSPAGTTSPGVVHFVEPWA